MKKIDTLVEDIYALFDPDKSHTVSEENLDWFCEVLKDVLRTGLAQKEGPDYVRFSNLGYPDRKLWHTIKGTKREPMLGKTYMKFMYGHVIEALALFLAKEAGHTVTHLQEEVEVDGVKGHMDAMIDGVVVDVKSAAPYGFNKFRENRVLEDDLFGYAQQLAGYSQVVNPGKPAAWVAMNKIDGDLCVSPMSASVVNSEEYNVKDRISRVRALAESESPPPKCYEDVPDGASGNRKLSTGCSYCPFKRECWPELRTFLYSNGPRYLTKVVKTPNVFELEK